MSSARKEVFLSKVLTKLYPNPPDFQTTLYKNETQLTEENIKETVQLPVPSPAEDKTMETRRRHRRKKKVDTTHASTHDKGQSVQETLHPPQKMEGMARCSESAPMVEQILEIMDQIKSGAMPFSEVQLLHHLKSLLLLQDIERLNNSLDSFKEQSSLPLDLVRALCTLFDYWITNILPIKTSNPTK
ncbi:hypothetical protein GDO81_007809 [Engystomops pustulosus]|uniref:Uncharacterized protein n=1 Tax=Engystomops pustulosus TaxID=76066 RepID=A0AAV7CAY0_ENGPU|nr:hypothetical protein GDO81_007809 [Engystomops pustulosus]